MFCNPSSLLFFLHIFVSTLLAFPDILFSTELCYAFQREKEELEHEYKKELHERQSKFTERNNTLVKVIEGLKNEKKKIGEQFTHCLQEVKRLQLTIKLAQNSQAAIAQINDEASSPVRSGQNSVLPGDKGAKNEAIVEVIDNMDEEEVHVSQNRIKSVIHDKENFKNQVIVKGLSKKVTKPRNRCVTAPRALIGSHEFHTLSMIPENEMYHLGANQFRKFFDDMETTMISAGNSNEIEDRSAYSLPSPFSLQAKATPVPLLWESDEGNGKSGVGVSLNRDHFHALGRKICMAYLLIAIIIIFMHLAVKYA